MPKQTLDFEKNLDTLDKLVTNMESGDLSLEDALKAYEKGIKLIRDCQQTLSKAEQKVQILAKKAGIEELEDFEEWMLVASC